jgi:uncharacterized protein (DUF2384 family)
VAGFRAEKQHDSGAGQLPSDVADRMSTVISLAARCLGSPAAIRDFLIRDHMLLAGRPIDAVMESSAGRDDVLDLLSSVHRPHLPIAGQER